MTITFKLNKQQSRRLLSVAKTKDNISLIITNNLVAFFADSIEYFKAVTFNVDSDCHTSVYDFSSQLILATCNNEGVLSLNIDNGTITFTLTNDTGKCIGSGVASSMPVGRYTDIIRYLTMKNLEPFKLEALKKAKDLVTLCSATNTGITISNKTVATYNNDLQVYVKLEDDCINGTIGVTQKSIKEIEKFGTDCNTYSIHNYLVFSKSGYTLAVRKSNVSDTDLIPEYLTNDNAAIACFLMNVNNLSTFLQEVSFTALTKSYSKCVFNLRTGLFTIKTSTEEFKFNVKCDIINQQDTNKTKIQFELKDIYPLRKVITLNNDVVQFSIYNRIARLGIGPINILMRCSLE